MQMNKVSNIVTLATQKWHTHFFEEYPYLTPPPPLPSPGYYTFLLHARKSTLELTAKHAEDAAEWLAALQDAIDSTPPIQTLTERLILEIIVRHTLQC